MTLEHTARSGHGRTKSPTGTTAKASTRPPTKRMRLETHPTEHPQDCFFTTTYAHQDRGSTRRANPFQRSMLTANARHVARRGIPTR
jgi:hypothetical protein